ncbi:MAG: 4-hydroxythreonine-4-phosphate dehydrogenase PdxA [Hahellaceae bacterium]|nr:4-hydroxythreonine-4-phosphate dehydrogenase PdxA [Hahellaceae bacterium]
MIVVTSGEPAGIGPDICLSLASQSALPDVVFMGDPDVFRSRATQLGLQIELEVRKDGAWQSSGAIGSLRLIPFPLSVSVPPGQPHTANAQVVLDMLRTATTGCLSNRYSAMVTAPVHKGIINEAGISFTGHTEFLQHITGSKQVVMMLASEVMRVALVTTHLPLAAVPRAITRERLELVIQVLEHDLRTRFGLSNPRILVAGLNPHAGEGGHMGREEIDVINPVLERLRGKGLDLIGPLPADTLFCKKWLDQADAVLAMYHDQGLPVLKYQSFGTAANITLGMPIIRTSVDHGTAFDLAGTGQADHGSLLTAIQYARLMAEASAGESEHDA